ncbi:hypothetical protein DPMN_045776 [Dreissena polymorpha]|uniref:Cytochrome c oxidase copper chaperone n=1 Tax=Dreissena polymorpha TaxID=45954 RepID=A0A9D4D6Y1_DREPO|nr:hypothetical protein DPMN_045776 [Dreissena polymorpha]
MVPGLAICETVKLGNHTSGKASFGYDDFGKVNFQNQLHEHLRNKLKDIMGQTSVTEAPKVETPTATGEKPKCKPCCACPETRKPRDECIAEKGPEKCQDLIKAHIECMRKAGFNV